MPKPIHEILQQAIDLDAKIMSFLREATYDRDEDLSGLNINYDDLEQLFVLDELRLVADRLGDAHRHIAYLKLPIVEISTLRKNDRGRYETESSYEYTCGDLIEVMIEDDYKERTCWVRSSVEHSGTDYYIVHYRNVPMEGLTVRRRKQ